MNGYILLANLLVFLHLLYVGFVVVMVPVIIVGGIMKWKWVRNFWFRLVHVLMIGVVVVETAFAWTCPLTIWENDLRVVGGQMVKADDGEGYRVPKDLETVYQEDFVGRMMRRVLFFTPDEVPQWVLNSIYIGFGVMIFIMLVFIPPTWPRKRSRFDNQVIPATA